VTQQSGARLFSRYACQPNELGYCGPAEAAYLRQVAAGQAEPAGVRPLARQFSGAWIYQQVIAEMSGLDPLDEAVVRGYWTGNALTAGLDRAEFWARLRAAIPARASEYWRHLNDDLAPEAAPGHAFHVLGVYPWTRLLATGRPEPVEVLTNCLIRIGQVLEGCPRGGTARVAARALSRVAPGLRWVPVQIEVRAPFDDLMAGHLVAIHWNTACDILTPEQADTLVETVAWQTERTNQRLAQGQG
jgi:hypothetical protein